MSAPVNYPYEIPVAIPVEKIKKMEEEAKKKNEEEKKVEVGDFLYKVLSGDAEILEEFVESDAFKEAKKNKDIHQEIMIAIRTAINKGRTDMVRRLDNLFNLNSPDDKTTPYLAALSGKGDIFHIFSHKDKVFRQKFAPHEHPLVGAFKSGNTEMATWMKDWSDKNGVTKEVKAEAINAAAIKGDLEMLKLYKISDPHKASVIANLVKYGHADLIPCILHDMDDNGKHINDYSYNNFQMLQAVSGNYDATAAMLRHPSLASHLDKMPVYYRAIYNAEKKLWKAKRDAMIQHHKELVAQKANQIHGHGASRKSAIYASMMEHKPILLRCLADAGLDSF